MFKRMEVVLASLFILTMISSTKAFGVGSGGYRNEVVDAEAAGKGFSFVAQADNPSAVHYNPAGLTQLKGSYITLGYAFEAPMFSVNSDATGDTVHMQKQVFYLPNVYYVTDCKENENLRFGFGANSPYGLSTRWATDSFAKFVSTKSKVEMANFNPTVAYKVNDCLSLGAGIDFFRAYVAKHKVLSGTLSSANGDFLLKGNDENWGYNLGILLNPSEKQRIGISYRSPIHMELKGKVTMDNLNNIAPYFASTTFGGSSYTTEMKSKSTIPGSVALGYAYQPNNKWTFEADVEWTHWSSTQEELVTYPNETDATRLAILNSGNPASRDWRNVFAYGVGAEYQATEKLQLRGGLLYEKNPIPSANFEPVLPDSSKYGVTTGVGYLIKNVKIDAAYAFLKYNDRSVTNDVGASTGSNIDGKYKGYVNILALSLTYKF